MRAALVVEARKLLRSRVVLTATLLQLAFVPVLAWLLVHAPELGGGALAAKGELLVEGEGWPAYLSAVGQVTAAGVFVGAGIVVAWVMAREHADGTFGALFALPVGRGTTAAAKLVVVTVWGGCLAVALLAVSVGVGLVDGIGVATTLPSAAAVGRLLAVALGTTLLAVPVALVASIGRGYLPGIAAVIVLVAVAQVAVFLGLGGWFPWTVPGLLAVADTTAAAPPTTAQVAVAVATVPAAAAATIAWWRQAEVV